MILPFLDKLKLLWTKAYLWVGLAAIVLLMILLFWRRKVITGTPTPGEVDALKAVADGIKIQITKADNDAQIKIIKAEAKEDALRVQVEQIEKMDNEFEKAKQLVLLRKAQTGPKA
jgi:hypothetical protein